MEKQKETTLMKERGYRSVITTALHFYTSSFRKIFKATWPFTLAFCLIAAITGALLTTYLIPVGLQLLILPGYRWMVVQEHLPLIGGVVLLMVANLALLVMIGRSAGRRLQLFQRMKQAVRAALRHWALTLGILLLGFIVLVPVCLLLSLPVIILTTACIQAQMGTLIGDPLGLPTYFPWMAGATWLLAAFLQVYVLLILLVVGYYAYGSVETRQRDREKQNRTFNNL